jgi:Holliday junction resolvase RusA-like endonuclease
MRISAADAEALQRKRRAGSIPPTDRPCATCGRTFKAVWARSKHCPDCGGRQTTSVLDVLEREPFLWSVLFTVPYSLDASKNRRWSLNGKSTVFLNRSVRAYSDMIITLVRQAMRGQKIAQNKVWLSFFVEKENHRSDAINVVDTLCDAIKVALDLDDRWFCIDRVDWAVKKSDQNIIVKISQTTDADAIVCSHCGELKELDAFGFKRGGPLDRNRVCKPCVSVLSKHAKRVREKAA